MTVLVPDYLAEVNLREAEIYEVTRTTVTSSNITAGTESLDVITFNRAEDFEILAVALQAITTVQADATATVPPRAARERHAFEYLVTTLDSFNGDGDRTGDYFAIRRHVRSSEAFEDETNGTGGVSPGTVDEFMLVHDPGRDNAESPLVLEQDQEIRVHKQIGQPGIAADEEAHQFLALHVWGEDVPESETRVRESFPSEGGTTI